jgi:hypothetical protein
MTGARGSSAKVGTFLRVYDKAPDYQDEMGVRAEIEVSRSGPLAAIDQEGDKRAMALLSTDKALAAEFQAILDQSSAPWWDPATLWDRPKDRTAEVFADHQPGAAHALLGQAA